MSHCCLILLVNSEGTDLVQFEFLPISGRSIKMREAAWRVGVVVPLTLLKLIQCCADNFALLW